MYEYMKLLNGAHDLPQRAKLTCFSVQFVVYNAYSTGSKQPGFSSPTKAISNDSFNAVKQVKIGVFVSSTLRPMSYVTLVLPSKMRSL